VDSAFGHRLASQGHPRSTDIPMHRCFRSRAAQNYTRGPTGIHSPGCSEIHATLMRSRRLHDTAARDHPEGGSLRRARRVRAFARCGHSLGCVLVAAGQ